MKLVSFDELKPVKGIKYSRVHLRRLVKKKAFPKPIPLSEGRIAWDEKDLDAWLDGKKRDAMAETTQAGA